MVFHKHHIIPRHAGGSNDPSNLLKCNIAMHAFMHQLRYQEEKEEYDRLAYLGLSKQITTAELHRAARVHSNKTREFSKESRKKLSDFRKTITGKDHPRAKPVNIYDFKTDLLIAENVLMSDYAKENNLCSGHLNKTAKGKYKHHKGVYARYI